VLLPIYLSFLGVPDFAPLTLVYTLAIALLMVSRLPVFSGKRLGTRVPREMVLPVFVVVVLFVALLTSYPWIVLSIGTILYLGCLPVSWISHRRLEQKASAALAHPSVPPASLGGGANPPVAAAETAPTQRPERLN
jgi:CDP-diacylglycerol--serine O-phosphatidyltransferase